jgi:lysophospholipase L1-like esterase
MIGGNDLLRASPWLLNGSRTHILQVAERLHENMTEIVTTVKRPTNKLVVCTIYNPFPNSLIAEEYTEIVNKLIRKLAYQRHLILADVQKGFLNKEEQLIDGYKRGKIRDFKFFGNPIHPNDDGHAEIARTVLRAYRRRLLNQQTKKRRRQ